MNSGPASTRLPVIEVSGSHEAIGQAVGEALRNGLQASAERHRSVLSETIGWERALECARIMIPFAERALPNCVAELRGTASASGIPFETLFSVNSLQETRFLAASVVSGPDQCTSLAVAPDATANGHVLLAHNEDASAIRRALPYVLQARPDTGPSFVAFAYSGLMLYQGVNSHGLGSTGNALYFPDIRPGFPKLLAYRDVLAAPYLEDAIRRTFRPERANGNNHLIANCDGDIYDIEVSGGAAALIAPDRPMLVHTNHAVHESMKRVEGERDVLNSVMRKQRVERILEPHLGCVTVDTLFDVLSDHSNYPRSVCKHADPVHNPDTETVASIVIDLTARELHVRPGHPCATETVSISLSA